MEAVDHRSALGVAVGATVEEIRAAYQARLHELRVAMMSGQAPPADAIDQLRKAFIVLTDAASAGVATEPPVAAPESPVAQAQPAPPSEVQLTAVMPLGTPAAVPEVVAEEPIAVAATAEAAPAPASAPREFRLSFHGDGAEYFRIWIVNLFLTIVTAGIYSVWAKVRREKYLHGAMALDGSSFEYHGTPAAIFRGRALAFLIFAALSAAQKFSPSAYGGLLLLLTPLVPWFAVRAFRFRAHNTSYRGIRFAFHGTYREAMTAIFGYGVLSLLTGGLAYPHWYAQLRLFVVNNLSYGATPLRSQATARQIAGALMLPLMVGGALLTLVVVGLAIAAAGVVAAGKAGAVPASSAHAGGSPALIFVPLILMLGAVSVMLLIQGMFKVRSANLLLNGASIGNLVLRSELTIKSYLALAIKNWLLTLLTLGLYMPFAQMRMARYRTESLGIEAPAGLDEFVGAEAAHTSAIGDEASEIFDLDIGI